jgi:purine-binding chemotaxis protein CheW
VADRATQENPKDDRIVQLMAFRIGDEEYVVDILRVREILRPMPITPVRRGPKYIEGVINLRGAVVPVVDMRRRFELEDVDRSPGRIVVISIGGRTVGLIVDEVTQVVRVPRSAINPAPGLLESRRAPYFLGVCHHRDRLLILLNVKSVIMSDEPIQAPTGDALLRGEL